MQLGAISKYYDASQVGRPSMVATGNFGSASAGRALRGSLYGIPVYVTSNVVSGLQTYRNLLLHKSAFGFAIQNYGGGKIRVKSADWLENMAMLTVVDLICGVKILREPGAVLINASSSFIGS